jgi:Reverse transcriptase (RNA-dependent DNA polymerase)
MNKLRRDCSCVLCPNLSITQPGLVRHIGAAHKSLSLSTLNVAFRGMKKIFAECGHCGERFLESGLRGHITAMHKGEAPARKKPVPPGPWGRAKKMGPPAMQVHIQPFILPPLVDDLIVHPSPWEYGEKEVLLQEEEEEDEVEEAVLQGAAGEMSLGDLVGKFHRGAYYKHHSWKGPLQSIVLALLTDCVAEEEARSTRGIAALQLLPGLVEHCRSMRKTRAGTPIELLRSFDIAPDKATEIVRVARSWVPLLRVLPTEWPAPNVEHSRARIEALTAANRLSAAATALGALNGLLTGVPIPPPVTQEEMAREIDALHPADDERDILPDAEHDPPIAECMQLTPDTIRAKFYALQKKNTAAGNTGWTNEWLRLLGDDRMETAYVHTVTPPTALHLAFSAFFNRVLQGRYSGEGRDLLVTARLIMIPKPQGGLRPIRIECAIMRLLGAVAAAVARITVAPFLRPMQLGGGLRCGVEFGARMLDATYSREDCVISIDISNAFNTARHRPIWDGLATMYPGILRYYRMKHETASRMIGNDGALIGTTRTGVGQGDPWGSLFFEIGVHPALLQLAEAVKTAEVQVVRERHYPQSLLVRPGGVSAYEDDTQVRGEIDVMFKVAPLIQGIFQDNGFEVNVSKSKITGPQVDVQCDPPEDFVIDYEGIIALGIPVGSRDYRKRTTEAMIQGMMPPAAALNLLRPRTALQLLTACYDPRPAFLFRTAPDPGVTDRAAKDFDESMASAVARIFQVEVTTELKTRLYLPPHMGGLGLTRHDGMASEKNQILSRTTYMDFLSQYYPAERKTAQDHYDLSAIRLGAKEGLTEATGITELAMSTLTVKNCALVLSKGMKTAQKKICSNLHKKLLEDERKSHAAWFLSAAVTSTSFLFSTTGLEHDGYFGSAEFRCAGRNKLGVGPVNDQPGVTRVCHCRHEYDPTVEPFHGMSCALTKGYRNRRHNDIRDLLYKLLRKRFPALGPEQLMVEPYVGQTEGGIRDIRADIVWIDEAEKLIIDIACVDPGCAAYVKAPVLAWSGIDRAAGWMEIKKREHYAKVVLPLPLPANSIYPFVIEASGRLGKSAISLLNRICGTQTFLKSIFLRETSMIAARYMGMMLKATRDQYQGVH